MPCSCPVFLSVVVTSLASPSVRMLIGASLAAVTAASACSGTRNPATDTGTAFATGGSSLAGGATGAGDAVGSGGATVTTGTQSGGLTSTGGTTNVGGATASGGSSGSGCIGSYELIQGNTGLCVAKMVSISSRVDDAGEADYSIDATEVTEGQYDAWLSTNPEAPASTDRSCGWKKSYARQSTSYTGADAEHQPVVNVDWCDAYAYCEGVGKRLCGAIAGGPVAYSVGYADASISQWYRACTSGGTHIFPYGNTYQSSYCDGNAGSNPQQTTAVGSLGQCVTSAAGYAGVYDLSGNVSEWEDSCNPGGQLAFCRLRGGSFYNDPDGLTCGSDNYDNRNGVSANVGFRCCSL